MTADPLAQLGAQYRDAKDRHTRAVKAVKRAAERRAAEAAVMDELREPLRREIVAAAKAGRAPKVICELTGYGPERVRQILRAAGVEPFERDQSPS
ncbi:hypothetical protein MED01_002483 [Micromonospora sp. MED01]|uniref:hypothetical protein n=1 Tax=Micromonospora alfalfae TaxID=2911212 RepID=UPI001EE8625C|nr:hypothetical protein [Micromonospora alfalfae]MCG5464317.1 hypothetical protein [Micromonospora alfalfae]